MATNTHDHIEVAFVLIRAFNGLDVLDVLPKNGIVGRGHHLASDNFRKAITTPVIEKIPGEAAGDSLRRKNRQRRLILRRRPAKPKVHPNH